MNISHVFKCLEPLTLKSTNKDCCDIPVTGVVYDSRETTDGNVFVAVIGVKTDGHIYIPKSIESGACLIVC